MARYYEYVQQVEFLKIPLEEIKKILNQKVKDNVLVRYAGITHDKDKFENGEDKKPHVHIALNLNSDWSPSDIAKWFKDDVQRIQKGKGKGKYKFQNMESYLIHDTPDSKSKYQYSLDDVFTSGYDFKTEIDRIRNDVKEASNYSRINDVLSEIMENKIPRIKIGDHLSNEDRLKYSKQIETAYKIRNENLSKEDNKREMDVIYIEGEAGSGKTTLAKYIAKLKGYSCYVSSSSNDPLDGYLGQECLVLDDIRGSDWKINDLLKLLDNNTCSSVRSRFQNKSMFDCKMIILTSVLSIDELYKNLKDNESEPIVQLKRRCKSLFKLDENWMTIFEWESSSKDYMEVEKKVNPIRLISEVEKKAPKVSEFVNMIFDSIDPNKLNEEVKRVESESIDPESGLPWF